MCPHCKLSQTILGTRTRRKAAIKSTQIWPSPAAGPPTFMLSEMLKTTDLIKKSSYICGNMSYLYIYDKPGTGRPFSNIDLGE